MLFRVEAFFVSSCENGLRKHDAAAEESQTEPPSTNKQSFSPGEPELDDFGLPIRPVSAARHAHSDDSGDESDAFHDAEATAEQGDIEQEEDGTERVQGNDRAENAAGAAKGREGQASESSPKALKGAKEGAPFSTDRVDGKDGAPDVDDAAHAVAPIAVPASDHADSSNGAVADNIASPKRSDLSPTVPIPKREQKPEGPAVSTWSHQTQLPLADKDDEDEEEEEEWQAMPALDEFDVYDDNGRLVAKGNKQTEEETDAYVGLGGAGKGYTKLQLDEDAQSATSMDEDTNYLFQNGQKPQRVEADEDLEDEEQRDALTQLQATKDLLTEGQRIAYVGVVRLTIHKMFHALGNLEKTRGTKKEIMKALENMDMWGQTIMLRLYSHMDIDPAEQVMIEQLAEHGVEPMDLVAPLMLNAKIANPMADSKLEQQRPDISRNRSSTTSRTSMNSDHGPSKAAEGGEEVPEVHGPEDMPHSRQIELDLRWTVLCDLFLMLISGSDYDARSRRLLERVASAMNISWVQICRFEKRVIDALEMQEEESKENWDESQNLEKRRKLGLKRKYMMMGLATVGGGLVIGLSAGLLAPVIGAGLAAGFTTIGVTGTAGFLGGVGGAALITSAATAAGGTIAVRASDRRTGHVKTFEYRPLHNNKRLNLVLTVSGWMNGKIDDVRLPYSTVDPIMGDIYSLLWEPEMLQSMGDTINILATEALTQTVQQVLGSTILVALMASIQLPVVLSKLAYLIDNPWSVSLDRANAAGLILADSLIDRHLGQRPITLVGFSLGSRLIFSCLKELSNRGAYGIVQNVYLFGSPVVAKKDEYLRARSVVSGRFLNGYASNDWILGYLFRATAGGIMRVAGLAAVEGIPGIENLDVSSMVNGHMAYRTAMPKLMREVGWEVESDEFTEIEDPDPENHARRQRELIQEIDEARRKAEEKPEKKRFALFNRGRLAEKKGWETYDAKTNGHSRSTSLNQHRPSGELDGNVLFDIDAIRKELESEMIEVRELDSTLPPMQITSVQNGEKHVEYLRLPPDMKPEEVARMNLPPRPDEVDIDFAPPAPIRPARVSSLRPSSLHSSPRWSPRSSPQRSPQPSPGLDGRSSFAYSEPRELVSTMPPLALDPALTRTGSHSTPPLARPDLKQHATAPSASSLNRLSTASAEGRSSPAIDLNIERNAWADDDDDGTFGRDRGSISMTFE
ncbi:hypothetical protein LTR67_000085 [Exophiala xenobiotica]